MGHYSAGVVDNTEELLERHKVATRSSFGTRTSTKKAAGPTPANKENCDPQIEFTISVSQEFKKKHTKAG